MSNVQTFKLFYSQFNHSSTSLTHPLDGTSICNRCMLSIAHANAAALIYCEALVFL